MAHLLSRIGAFAHRRRLAVVLVWLAVLVAGGVGAVTLSGETSNSFSIPGQESTVAQELITEEFGAGGATVDVAVASPEGSTLTDPQNAGALAAFGVDPETATAERTVRVAAALAALGVLTLAAHQKDLTVTWRPHMVVACFDALGHRRPVPTPEA